MSIARGDAITALNNGAPLDEVAAALFAAENTSASEQHYTIGYRAALVSMLVKVLGDLGYHDTEATRAAWVIEREQTVQALRGICDVYGDNDWSNSLNLADVVNKHLLCHMEESSDE